jgi:hypothetical protein
MTTKEIAEAAGVSVDTIQRAAKELYPGKFGQGKRVAFIKSEAIEVMKAVRKRNFVELPQSAEVLPQGAEAVPGYTLSERDIALVARVVSATVAETIKGLNGRIEKIEGVVDQRRALLPAPSIKPRDHINMIVREYASKNKIEHRDAWRELYRQFSYRTNTNPTQCAKNREMAILDYIEAEGMIDLLEAVALDVYGGAA